MPRLSRALLTVLMIMVGPTVSLSSDCKPFIIDVLMGEPVPMDAMVDDLASVRVVFVGEIHTIDRHHAVQAEILKLLAERNAELALGLEMFGTHQQPVLDKWQKGTGGISELIKDLGPHFWTNLPDYKSLLLAARDRKIPILGLNASDSIVKKVARKGLDSLTPEERKEIPADLEKINPNHDRLLRMKLPVHRSFHGKRLDNIVLAQVLRDATMAGTAAQFLKSTEGSGRILMVVAGSGHVNYGFGVPERVEKLTGFSYRIVLPTESGELVLSEEDKRQSMEIDISHEDLKFIRRPIADYLHVIPRKEPPPSPVEDPIFSADQPKPGPSQTASARRDRNRKPPRQ